MNVLIQYLKGASKRHSLSAPVVLIGRDREADIVIEDSALPEVAVKLEKTLKGYAAANPAKHKSVLLNGRVLKTAVMLPGDRLEICGHVFTLDILEDKPAQETGQRAPVSGPAERKLESALARFAQTAAEEKDLSKVLEKILKLVAEFTGGTEAIIFTLSGEGRPKATASIGLSNPQSHFSDTVIQDVLNSGRGVAVPNALSDKRYAGARSIIDLKLTTVLCTPIVIGGSTIGLIYIGCRAPSVSYDEKDLQYLNVYALMAGMIIHNVDYITQQHASLRRLAGVEADGGVIAQSAAMQKVLDRLGAVAVSDISILLQGETGTGKDLIANYTHRKSKRRDRPFIAVNCSSLRSELLESELFGHKKGAFTGAVSDKEGLFQAAAGGTLFLDEIGEMAGELQAKLLRVLEAGRVRPVGSVSEKSVDVRVLAATNRNLEDRVKDGLFREDLFYRLAQITIQLPPLRERGEDVLLLAHYFLDIFRAKYPQKKIRDFHPDAVQSIMNHEWPGNARELYNVLHRSVLTGTGPYVCLDMGSFQQKFATLDQATKRFQKNYIERALAMHRGSREDAAEALGMSRSTFFRYLSQLGVEG